ncbi:MAG TPA: universal stress protein [Planctomycetaceae bacterium]|nr:universal stress protein [Planctomycetaceae bacterium]
MLPRFRHLLAPLDFTEKNRSALDLALEIAVQNKARVTLLHVIETVEGVDDADMRPFFDRLERRAESELELRSQPFAAAGIAVDRKIRFGHRTAEIVQDAVDREADLIVMSSHPIDPARPVRSWGTVSYQVSVLCRCPILLVK